MKATLAVGAECRPLLAQRGKYARVCVYAQDMNLLKLLLGQKCQRCKQKKLNTIKWLLVAS